MPSLRALLRLGLSGPVLDSNVPNSANFPALPRPEQPLCIIGDLHGMADLLDAMLNRIADQPGAASTRILLVGDLIDRGPDSAAVLRRVHDLCRQEPDHVTCLMGNHERMMLDFLANPATHARRWLNAGGMDTLHSFGLPGRTQGRVQGRVQGRAQGHDPASRFAALAAALRAALPPGLHDWLAGLPLYWQTDGLVVVHADADPALPMAKQTEATLLWGHRTTQSPRSDQLWLIHGHRVVPTICPMAGRVAVDTGACHTGTLSALWLDRNGARVIKVGTTP